jgi:hypothetical protein
VGRQSIKEVFLKRFISIDTANRARRMVSPVLI